MSDERLARAGVAAAWEPGSRRCAEAVAARGPVLTWESLLAGEFGAALQTRARGAEPTLSALVAPLGDRRFVVPGDAEWPAGLADLAGAEFLHELGGAALGLWVRGERSVRTALADAVAMVGSRAATYYGQGVASDVAAELGQSGFAVVSGGAYGIDAAAHRGALAGGGATACFLAGGVDVPYPAGNAELLARIARDGLVLSEYAPGSHPLRNRFLARNRLIAAATRGTVLVEAAARSGARNTVTWANLLGRVVMAVPGLVTSAMSVTPHRLIRDQEAALVTSAAEVVDLVTPIGQATLFDAAGPDRVIDELRGAERALYEALPGRGSAGVDELALAAGVSIGVALATLAALESRGMARRTDSGYALAARRGSDRTTRGSGISVRRREPA